MNWKEREGAIWVEAVHLSDLSAGDPQQLTLSPSRPGWKQRHDLEVFIVPRDSSPVVLLSDCTHERCPVVWKEDHFVCPCHGSFFDREGGVVTGPAAIPLTRLPTYVEGQSLWIKVRDLP